MTKGKRKEKSDNSSEQCKGGGGGGGGGGRGGRDRVWWEVSSKDLWVFSWTASLDGAGLNERRATFGSNSFRFVFFIFIICFVSTQNGGGRSVGEEKRTKGGGGWWEFLFWRVFLTRRRSWAREGLGSTRQINRTVAAAWKDVRE